jgi:3-deoxy-7-phosphoheptulonate synthase
MIVSLKQGADAKAVQRELVNRGLWIEKVEQSGGGPRHYVIAEHSAAVDSDELARIDGVESVSVTKAAHPMVDKQPALLDVRGVKFGGGSPVYLCGPCSVESEEHASDIAAKLAPLGVQFLRGGAFKPRTSPYAFQGHGVQALGWLRRAADRFGMRVVTEALSEADVPMVAEHADLIQIGSRNMHNYALLKAVGRTRRAVMLKRGMAATVDEWLLAGEYLLANGSSGVVFCERGIRSFDPTTRNLLDLGAVALLANVHGLPVVVDPSHGAGRRDLVLPLARAALAAGAAGVMIETHDDPASALSDGPQAIPLQQIGAVINSLAAQARAANGGVA